MRGRRPAQGHRWSRPASPRRRACRRPRCAPCAGWRRRRSAARRGWRTRSARLTARPAGRGGRRRSRTPTAAWRSPGTPATSTAATCAGVTSGRWPRKMFNMGDGPIGCRDLERLVAGAPVKPVPAGHTEAACQIAFRRVVIRRRSPGTFLARPEPCRGPLRFLPPERVVGHGSSGAPSRGSRPADRSDRRGESLEVGAAAPRRATPRPGRGRSLSAPLRHAATRRGGLRRRRAR